MLKQNQFGFDFIYTSVLKRAIQTADLCLKAMDNEKVPIEYHWQLNERHYGALQGLSKTETANKYGESQVLNWRRSYETAPPLLNSEDERHPKFDKKYQNLKKHELPIGECLKDTVNRVMPLWDEVIVPKILSGKRILIVAHGNSLRALIKYLDKISDNDIMEVNIPTGIPLVYELDKGLNPIQNYYLGDTHEIEKKLTSVIQQGKAN